MIRSAVSPPPIFIVGMNGSGTTVLRDHLANHSQIYGFPSETRSMPFFIANQVEFGDLAVEANFVRLWEAIKGSVSKSGDLLPTALAVPEGSKRSAAGCFDHIMRHLAEANGKRTWCEKTPMYVLHLALLAAAFPDAKFIHVIRDGRDCAASFHRRWKFNPVRTAARWKHVVREGRRQGRDLGKRYHEVRYESFIDDPEATFRTLLDFLGLPYEQSVLTSSAGRGADKSTVLAKTVVRNTRNAESYFGRNTIDRMEKVAGRLLTELGYASLNEAGDDDPPAWRLRWWRMTDDARRFLMVAVMSGRFIRPGKWGYVATRVRNALKQRATTDL